MRALSAEDIEGICHERPPAEDKLFFGDVGVTDGPSASHKRTRPSSMYTIISPAAVPDLTSEPELEDPRSAKRRRPAERQAESLILDPEMSLVLGLSTLTAKAMAPALDAQSCL